MSDDGRLWRISEADHVDEYADAVDLAQETLGARMFSVFCARCSARQAPAAEVFDTTEGALFLAQIPQHREGVEATAVRARTGRHAPYPTFGIAVLLEATAPDPDRIPRASCPKKHGELHVDRDALVAAVATYRRRGKVAPIRATPLR